MENHMGPPDYLAPLLVEAFLHILDGDETPYLWKIGGNYVWWDLAVGCVMVWVKSM